MRIVEKDCCLHLQGVRYFNLARTLDCGQSFRWRLCEDGFWEGVASGRFCRVRQEKTVLIFAHTNRQEILDFWIPYFCLDEDYAALCRDFRSDPALARAMRFAPGIRLLRQEPWETLCTFIISQNNHIPRIRGIVGRLCDLFGSPTLQGPSAFPEPEQLAGLSTEDLAPLRCGFRAKYLLDAAQKAAFGAIDFTRLSQMRTADARQALCSIYGVGPKVADCVLLYGLHKTEVIPMDVWMKRVMSALYPMGLPDKFAPYGGIAQQFLFHYARHHAFDLRPPVSSGQ